MPRFASRPERMGCSLMLMSFGREMSSSIPRVWQWSAIAVSGLWQLGSVRRKGWCQLIANQINHNFAIWPKLWLIYHNEPKSKRRIRIGMMM